MTYFLYTSPTADDPHTEELRVRQRIVQRTTHNQNMTYNKNNNTVAHE